MKATSIIVRSVRFLACGCLLAGSLAAGQAPLSMPARKATEYALTSSYSWEHPDPNNWRLLGSNDGGRSWVVLDVQTNQVFRKRSERRVYALTNSTPFNTYRFEVDKVELDVELAELELKGPVVGVTQEADLEMKVTASFEHPLIGPAAQAFDNDPTTKWLAYSSGESKTCWIQCQYTTLPAETELANVSECIVASRRMAARNPLLDKAGEILAELNATASKPVRALSGYAITSANDCPGRDPRDWRLLGSNDGGRTWHTLDARRNESFVTRFQRRVFSLTDTAAYALYRLQIDSVRGPFGGADGATSMQLAEFEPLCAAKKGEGTYAIAVQARGDNPPIETVEMAFDGDSKTKWLDFTQDSNTNKSTWVNWQYFAASGSPVINVRRLRAAKTHPQRPIRLGLRGVAVAWRPDSGTLGFLDQTGFQIFRLGATVSGLKAGMRIRLAGVVQFGAELPVVAKPEIELLGELPVMPEVSDSQPVGKDMDFGFGVAEGKASSISEDAHSVTIGMAPEKGGGRLLVRVVGPRPDRLPFAPGSRLRAEGVVEPVFNDRGQRVAGVLWVADFEHAALAAPKEGSAAKLATPKTAPSAADERAGATGIARVNDLRERQPGKSFPVTVRGVITYIDLSFDFFYIQDGPDGIMVGNQLGAGLAPFLQQEGSYIELEAATVTNQPALAATSLARILGRGQMPEPLHHTLDYLMTGRDDGQWVQVEGVVSACEEHRLTLSVLGGRLMVWINELDKDSRSRLVGCQVRVNGVCSPLTTMRNQRLGVRLLVSSGAHIEVVTRPPKDPFNLRARGIGRLLQSDGRQASVPTALVKTVGVVTHREPLMLFIQDGTEGLRVLLRKDGVVDPGDQVEVVGFAEPDGFSARLVQALVRKVGRGSLPPAPPIDLLGSDLSDRDATRGQIDATYLGRSTRGSMQILELRDSKGQRSFSALFPADWGLVPSIPVGSRVRVQGVLKADTDTLPDYGKVMASFQLYANSPRDLTLLARPPWWNLRLTLWGLAGASAAALACLGWVGLLRRQVAQRTLELRMEVDQRRRTAANLEAEIAERKRMEAQVEKTHKELLHASRRAGMADVASSVLHNVGNVLNSVNVSASLIAAKLRHSRTANLAKLADLLRAHKDDLGEFISNDPKGRHLPNYLDQLVEHLLAEQASASTEMASLMQNVEHIKGIVAMQQSYTKVVGVSELASPVDLVEEALRIPADGLVRHAIELVREFDSGVPTITVDKHKVILVLVNLLQNAKHACEESGRPDKRLTVRLARQDSRVTISVIDNGVGIPPENLTRIFNHGFTTRKDGHGFGLHSSALAAREMGGALVVHSDGCGKGATFTLDLPPQPAANPEA